MIDTRRAAWWLVPPLVCLTVHWYGFRSWFRADDFAWLGVGLNRHGLHDYLAAMFSPMAQGTIRPWSDRLFFMVGFRLFGLDALPFRLVIFATHFLNLSLVAWIGARLAGRRAAGFAAALLWTVNNTLVEPLGWASAFNQVLCACFVLVAFSALLRYLETGLRRYYVLQWIAFLLGFGANELNVVYPALAAAYVFLCARKRLSIVWPLFVPSLVYTALHFAVATGHDPNYTLHFTGSMLRTLGKYWCWTVGPFQFWTPVAAPEWMVVLAVLAISAGLVAFAWRRGRLAGFCLLWFVIAIAPVLPLRDHVIEYYPMLSAIGLCWLGGWALTEGRRGPAVALAGLYLFMMLPRTVAASAWNFRLSMRTRNLIEDVAHAHESHPEQTILLEGMDPALFHNAIKDHPFRLFGVERLYLTAGSVPGVDTTEFLLPTAAAQVASARGQLAIYDVRGPLLRSITSSYRWPHDASLPQRVDAGSELAAPLLGPEWYPPDGNHRWMPKRSTLHMAGPTNQGQELYLRGYYPQSEASKGLLEVTVRVDNQTLASAHITSGGDFELRFPLPAELTGRPEIQLTVEVSRTFRTALDMRDLGLAFGEFEIR